MNDKVKIEYEESISPLDIYRTKEEINTVVDFIIKRNNFSIDIYQCILQKIKKYKLQLYFRDRFFEEYINLQKKERKIITREDLKRKQRLMNHSKRTELNNRIAKIRASYNIPEIIEEEKKQTINKKSRIYELDWDDVYFSNAKYLVSPQIQINGICVKPLCIKEYQSLECYNYIKSYFKKRLPAIKFCIQNNEITILNKPKFRNAILMIVQEYKQGMIEKRLNMSLIKKVEKQHSFSNALSLAKRMSLQDFKKYKSKYIDFLVDKQLDQYCIIPCSESFSYKNICYCEGAFIFTVAYSSKHILIIFENVYPDRSTLIFKVESKKYMDGIKLIYTFMQSNSLNKRSDIRSNEILFGENIVIDYDSINHEYITAWEEHIKQKIQNL